jgi:hypothetical protein
LYSKCRILSVCTFGEYSYITIITTAAVLLTIGLANRVSFFKYGELGNELALLPLSEVGDLCVFSFFIKNDNGDRAPSLIELDEHRFNAAGLMRLCVLVALATPLLISLGRLDTIVTGGMVSLALLVLFGGNATESLGSG